MGINGGWRGSEGELTSKDQLDGSEGTAGGDDLSAG